MKVRAIYKPDGSVRVIHPAPNSRKFSITKTKLEAINDALENPDIQNEFTTVEMPLCMKIARKKKCSLALEHEEQYPGSFDFEPENQWLSRVFEKATPEGLSYEDIEASKLPDDREDRESWERKQGGGVKVNQEKAAKIRKGKKQQELIEKTKKKNLEDQTVSDLKAGGLLDSDGNITAAGLATLE